jgi:hypothetical protein
VRFGEIRPALRCARHTTTEAIVGQRVIYQGDGYEKKYFEQFACLVFVTAGRMPDGNSKW